jgi:hypothetical protein
MIPVPKLTVERKRNIVVTYTNIRSMSSSRRKKAEPTNVAVNHFHIQPQPMDVMLGRGKSFRKNPGNMAFQGNVKPTE